MVLLGVSVAIAGLTFLFHVVNSVYTDSKILCLEKVCITGVSKIWKEMFPTWKKKKDGGGSYRQTNSHLLPAVVLLAFNGT